MHLSPGTPAVQDSARPVGQEIAVVGMSGRFPGAATLARFWANLRDGVESIRFFTADELLSAGVPADQVRDPRYVPAQAVLDDVESFDESFFGLTPRDATLMDPQQRLLLECAWEALETAGYVGDDPRHTIGVYVGVGFPQYLVENLLPAKALTDHRLAAILNDKDHAATRIAHRLGLTGPALTVQTACSSSLVSVHQATLALLAGECDIALAGGMTVRLPRVAGHLHVEGGVDSADGHCRAFGADANGLVRGSGGGVVVLRRLDDALADGDTVLAVIRGTAVNNDGSDKLGYTAPSREGQTRVIRAAHRVAGVGPEDISYVEAHGTGTLLGDPIEVAALTEAFRTSAERAGHCALGSVKSGIGHLDVGAGIAGLIKTVLALRHRQIPPTLHVERTNPQIDFEAGPFRLATRLQDWPSSGAPRLAGVSSFGIGGTNAHVVLAEAPAPKPPVPADQGPQLLVLSARTEQALDRSSALLAAHLAERDDADLADVAHTLRVGRRAFPFRRAVVAADHAEAITALTLPRAVSAVSSTPAVVWLVPGQGSARSGAGAALYREEPAFCAAVDECARLLLPMLDRDIHDVMFPEPDAGALPAAEDTAITQPALFVQGYALARLWESYGVRPETMLGHSLGEYVVACLAGVFTLEAALRLVVTRGALMRSMPPGAMLGVRASEAELADELGGSLALAAVNGPDRCVLSGPEDEIAAAEQRLAERSVQTRRLRTNRAFHSAMTERILPEFAAAVRAAAPRPPRQRYVSSSTGTWITDDEAVDPGYWVRHLRDTVRFGDALATIAVRSSLVAVELGVDATLTALVRRSVAGAVVVCTVDGEAGERRRFLDALGRVWAAGVAVEWDGLDHGARRRVPLPTYPFERRRHWVEPVTRQDDADPAAGLVRTDTSEWTYLPYWRPVGPPARPAAADDERWLVVAGDHAVHRALAVGLAERGQLLLLRPGADYATELAALAQPPTRVVYWCPAPPGHEPAAAADEFADALRLAQELAALRGAVHLTIVTTGTQPVHAGEPVNLVQTPLLGLATVLPQECPSITCRAVDIAASPGTADTALLLADVVAADPNEPVVAVRSGLRWVPEVSPAALPEPGPDTRLRIGGTYLLTGGMGALGMEIAEFLAANYQANLVLTGRTPVPDARRWPELLERDACDALVDLARDGHRVAQWDRPRPELSARAHEASEQVDRLSVEYVRDVLVAAGVDTTPGAVTSEAEVFAALRVIPTYRRLVRSMLRMLADVGVTAADGDVITFGPRVGELSSAATTDAAIRGRFPEFAAVLDLLHRSVTALPSVVAGEVDPVSVLFPDGDASMFEHFARLIGDHSDQVHYLEMMREVLVDLARDAGRPVRVLEVGAGKGRLTGLLAESLPSLGVEYHVTDVSGAFAAMLKDRLDRPGLTFGTLDVGRDPVAQGLDPESFDVIVGFNVVHAAPDVRTAVSHLGSLLRPGGLLGLVETVTEVRWGQLIWGLTKGWWSFTDTDVRTDSPLMPADTWVRVLESAGYRTARALPRSAQAQQRTDTTVVLAQRSTETAETRTVRRLHALTRFGGAVMTRAVDVTDREGMRSLLDDAEDRFGRVDGVFHLAYVPGGPLIPLRTPAEVAAEFAPKVTGVLVLDELLRERDPDFLVLFSSLNALLGGYGAVGYAGAGAFLDRFPDAVRGRRSYPVVSVNWPLWLGLDTASATRLRRRMLPGGADQLAMSTEDGVEVFQRLVAAMPGPRVVVSPVRLPALLAAARSWRLGRGGTDDWEATASHTSPLEERVAEVWREVIGVPSVAVDTPFAELGGDSLIAMQIMARLRAFGLELSLREFFADPTIAGNARVIAAGPREHGATDGDPADEAELTALLDEIEQMSDAEVDRALVAESGERAGGDR